MILRKTNRPEADVALLEILLANLNDGRDDRRRYRNRAAGGRHIRKRLLDERSNVVVVEIPHRNDDKVRGDIGIVEVAAQRGLVETRDAVGRAEDRPAERMTVPVGFGEELVHQIVRRVLDHLDLFEDDLLLALDVFRGEHRARDEIRQDVGRERQVLVEHLDVVAGVLLRRESVELAADGIHLLGNVFRRPALRALEEHVLDEVGDPSALGGFVA